MAERGEGNRDNSRVNASFVCVQPARMIDHGNEDLAFAIAFALSRRKGTPQRVPKTTASRTVRLVAEAIIRQIEFSGWRLTERPPREAHSTHGWTGGVTWPDQSEDGTE